MKLVKVNNCVIMVTKGMIKQFTMGCPIKHDCMMAMLEFFKKRDNEIFQSYHDINSTTSLNYRPFTISIYFSPSLFNDVITNPNRMDYELIIPYFNVYDF